MKPQRIQRKRIKGWKMPENTVSVTRPGKWGNPFTYANSGRVHPVMRFACEVAPLLDVTPLRGKNLACYCAPGSWCHADVLLEIANAPLTRQDGQPARKRQRARRKLEKQV